jgi:hypothetical protein
MQEPYTQRPSPQYLVTNGREVSDWSTTTPS